MTTGTWFITGASSGFGQAMTERLLGRRDRVAGPDPQYVTLYQALQGFDDQAAQSRITCPRLCFAGSADVIDYGPQCCGSQVNIAGPILERGTVLGRLGWDVRCPVARTSPPDGW